MSTGTFIGMAHHKKLTERKQRPKLILNIWEFGRYGYMFKTEHTWSKIAHRDSSVRNYRDLHVSAVYCENQILNVSRSGESLTARLS